MGLGATPVVEISFDDGPYVASPTFVDVTSKVRSFTIHRGRASDFTQFDTGTATVVLDNRDRLFDPFYTSGVYYGKLRPRRQIRIRGTAASTTYDVFRGYVAGWPVEYTNAGKDSTVTIECFDALGLLANEVAPTDWLGYYTNELEPRRYYKFDDSRTTKTVRDTGSRDLPMNLSLFDATDPVFETQAIAEGAVGNCLSLLEADFRGAASDVSASDEPTDLTMAFNLTCAEFGLNEIEYQLGGSDVSVTAVGGSGQFQVSGNNSTNRTNKVFAFPELVPQHYIITVAANAGSNPTVTVYRNNVEQSPISTSTSAVSQNTSERFSAAFLTAIQEVSIFTRILTADERNTLYNYNTGRISETTTARLDRILDTTEFSSSLEDFTASPAATVAEIGSGSSVVAELQLVADSEGGDLYVAKDGKLTFTNRSAKFTASRSANVQATFTDSGAGLTYGPELRIEYDADDLKNDVTVNFSGGGEFNEFNEATITAYGGAATTIETQLDSPTSAETLALTELGPMGSLIPRISPIDVSTNTAAADIGTILGLELLDRVRFKRTPATGNQFDREALINAIDHQCEPGVWRTQLTLSMRYTSPLTLDDDVLGLLDLNYLG